MAKIGRLTAAALLVLYAGVVVAEPSCTDWMDQGNGTSWKTCVDDAGVQHCYSINNTPGSTASEVTCG